MRLITKFFTSIALLMAAAQAHAATSFMGVMSSLLSGEDPTSATTDGGAFFLELEKVASVAQSKFTSAVTDTMYAAGMGIGIGLIPSALAVGGSLALVYFTYQIVMTMGEKSNSSMINALFETCVPFVVAALLIKGYATYMDSFKYFLNILSTVGTDPVAGMTDFYGGALKMIRQAIILGIQNVKAAIGFEPTVMAAIDLLGVILVAIPILFLVVMGIAEVFGILILGPFLHGIAAAFGPIFIAGLVTPWTKTYFGTWLNFLVGAAVVTGVARVGLQIAAGIFANINIDTVASDAPVAAALLLVGVILMAVNTVISQIPGIASAMVPGNLGARSPTSGMIAAGKQAARHNPAATVGKWGTSKLVGGGVRGGARLALRMFRSGAPK